MHAHRSFDDSSGVNESAASEAEPGFLYYLRRGQGSGVWAIGPDGRLNDDNYARSEPTTATCPTASTSWRFWWGGGVSPLGLPFRPYPRGWATSARYPMSVSCWALPPSPPPPPPRPPPPPPPPPPAPPPPVRLVPGPYTGRLEIYYTAPIQSLSSGGTLLTHTVSAWGSVCDDGFGLTDAMVACRQLGLGRPLRYWRASLEDDDDAIAQSPRGPIWLENLQCGGDEVRRAPTPHCTPRRARPPLAPATPLPLSAPPSLPPPSHGPL